jgi:pSer/pThr/pTyr-binding forkhead associated (FHA) protein
MSWPDGYGTLVRNQGKNFSGGQRQRLAIARALLSDAHILVLDEPTAALDVEAELEVMKALERLVIGRTVLMISHRLSTLGKVDEIIVLKDGQIVEQGTYKDLKSRPGGVFADLLSKQKQYDADYAGGSMIVPQAEIARMIQQQRQQQGSHERASLPINGYDHQEPMRKARVIVDVDGKQTGEFLLNKAEMRVGRLQANDVHIPSARVSRLHARIRWSHGAWSIEDLQSLNGLNYQGNLTEQHIFAQGDRVYLAPRVHLTYQEEQPASRAYVPRSQPVLPVTPPPSFPGGQPAFGPSAPSSSVQPAFAPSPNIQPMTPQVSEVPARPIAAALPPTILSHPLKARVIIEVDQQAPVIFPLEKDMLTVGRHKDNDIQINSQLVSSHHARLMLREGHWIIVDLNSRNGLTHQGTKVDNYRLTSGDCLYLAPQVKLRFEQL